MSRLGTDKRPAVVSVETSARAEEITDSHKLLVLIQNQHITVFQDQKNRQKAHLWD